MAISVVPHLVGAILFAVTMIAFGIASFLFVEPKARKIAGESAVVSAITAVAYVSLACGDGFGWLVIDGRAFAYLLWLSYVPALYLIARSLSLYLRVEDENDVNHFAFVFALIGVSGVLGLNMLESNAGAVALTSLVVVTSLTYVYVLVKMWRAARAEWIGWFWAFVVATIVYVIIYVLGLVLPASASLWYTIEPWLTLVVNFFTKAVVLGAIAFILSGGESGVSLLDRAAMALNFADDHEF